MTQAPLRQAVAVFYKNKMNTENHYEKQEAARGGLVLMAAAAHTGQGMRRAGVVTGHFLCQTN